jgi:hypothetical protein
VRQIPSFRHIGCREFLIRRQRKNVLQDRLIQGTAPRPLTVSGGLDLNGGGVGSGELAGELLNA